MIMAAVLFDPLSIQDRPPQNVPVVTLSSYDMRAPILAAFPPKGQIVMVGDSLAEFAPWNGMFPNEEIANYGISGDTVVQNSCIAHVSVNWLSPVKVRQTFIGGSRKMIVYDDVEATEKNKGVR